jgi:hypothetical protein
MIVQDYDGSVVVHLGDKDVHCTAGVIREEGKIVSGHFMFSHSPFEGKDLSKLDGYDVPVQLNFKSLAALDDFIRDLQRLSFGWEDREELQK